MVTTNKLSIQYMQKTNHEKKHCSVHFHKIQNHDCDFALKQ